MFNKHIKIIAMSLLIASVTSLVPQAKDETKEDLDLFYYRSEYKALLDKNKLIEKELEELKAKQSKEIEDLRAENTILRSRVTELETQFVTVKDRSESNQKETETRITNLERENKILQTQKNELEKMLAEAKTTEGAIVKERTVYTDTITKIETERTTLIERLTNVTEEIERLKEINRANSLKLQEANEKISLLEGEKATLAKNVDTSKSIDTTTETSTTTTTTTETKEIEELISTLRKQNEELLSQRDTLLSEIEELKSSKTNGSTELEDEIAKLQKEYEGKIETLESENQKLKDDVERISSTKKNMEESLDKEIKNGDVEISDNCHGVVIKIPHSITFDVGSSKLKSEGKKVLAKVLAELNTLKIKKIQIEGNTDDLPVSSNKNKDNWDLSLSRSLVVLRYLATKGKIQPKYMTVAGNAEYNPIRKNDSAMNRALNRRVEILVIPSK